MPATPSSTIGKVIYGSVFIVGLPLLLVAWARATEKSIPLPAIESLPAGLAIAALGAGIMVWGMGAIFFYGRGLPMNAYPPERFVSEGIYRLLPHPIYTGFSILCFGTAVAAGSPSGLWLVSPAVVIGCIALVQGYEKQATLEHFGPVDTKPLIHLPPRETRPPTIAERISGYIIVLAPWFVFVQAARFIDGPISLSHLPADHIAPVYAGADPVYLARFLPILLAPLIIRTSRDMRDFIVCGSAVTGIAALLFIAFPLVLPPHSALIGGLPGELLVWDQRSSGNAVFSLASHAAFTLLAASFYARTWRYGRIPIFLLAALVCASGLFAGLQSIVSALAGFVIFFIAVKIAGIWELLRIATERIANSWKERRFGPVRFINHGMYAAAGAFVSLSIVGTLAGPANLIYVMLIASTAIAVSALWAQWIEGGTGLLRPYGWYGGVVGAIIGGFISYAAGGDLWLLAGAFCMGAPWVQAAGRLRCLVQGCCHGRETAPAIGITYTHPMSRVCRLSGLGGVRVHPTQLYSILCNAAVIIILSRLWLGGASLALITGVYFIHTGFGRFVEESLRGEPQTPVFGGLRLYQLFAILTVTGGIFVTMAGSASGTAPEPRFYPAAIIASAIFGIFALFAFGIDFPDSNKRFARLT